LLSGLRVASRRFAVTRNACDDRIRRPRPTTRARRAGSVAGPVGDDGEITEVQFLLPRPLLKELVDAADEEGITAARLLRRLVVLHLRGKGQ
jgi:hypothetical protein